jgi:hypothetical protein
VTPTDKPLDALAAYARACTLVDAHLLRRGVQHTALRDIVVDQVVDALRRHGLAEGARLVETIAAEAARARANIVEDALADYRAAGGSRGRR